MESFEITVNGQDVTVEYEYTRYYDEYTDYEDINITYVNAYTEEGSIEIDEDLILTNILTSYEYREYKGLGSF
jgi:hypothetical protein